MKKEITIAEQVREDAAIMEEYLHKDGEVPPVIFVHFKKINRKIANMMNAVPAGKLKVKNGFFLSLNEPLVMSARYEFLGHLGTIMAAMNLLNVLEEPEALVFCSEGWASEADPKSKKKQVRPKDDPKAKDVFIASGINKNGDVFVDIKEKKIKMVEIDGEKALKAELVKVDKYADNPADTRADVLEPFFASYKSTHEKMSKDKTYMQFSKQAEEDPVEAFRQGIEAALMMARLQALKSMN